MTILAWGNSIGGTLPHPARPPLLPCSCVLWPSLLFLSVRVRFVHLLPRPFVYVCADLVSDVTVARQGFAGMGIGACYGVVFNLLIGVGASLLYWTLRYGRAYIFEFKPNVAITMVALGVSLVSSVIAIPVAGFKLTRIHGIYLYAVYAAFFTVSILYEFNVVHF